MNQGNICDLSSKELDNFCTNVSLPVRPPRFFQSAEAICCAIFSFHSNINAAFFIFFPRSIETTINNPRRFKVYRETYRQGKRGKAWIPMRKGVADIYRRIEVSHAANARYLEALSVIGDEKPSHLLLDSISRPVYKNNHRYRGLRPIVPNETKLFRAVLHGEFLLRGFRNANIRALLFPITNSDEEKRRNMGRTSRLILLLRAHGLIKKVPKTRLYRITPKGHLVMSTSLIFRNTNISLLEKAA